MTSAQDAKHRENVTGGCLLALGSAVLTCLMLFAMVHWYGPCWRVCQERTILDKQAEVSQFILFSFPCLLVMANG